MEEYWIEEPSSGRSVSLARRRFLRTGAIGAAALLWGKSLEATEECTETEDNIEGPFYKPGAPERSTLVEDGIAGTRLTVSGRILGTNCVPLAGALLDVWQADDNGQYDNAGFKLRGRFHADSSGNYRLHTIVPRHYRVSRSSYRPSHIHVKVSATGVPLLTTQIYFRGDPYNATDSAFRQSLAVTPVDASGGKAVTFNFVLRAG